MASRRPLPGVARAATTVLLRLLLNENPTFAITFKASGPHYKGPGCFSLCETQLVPAGVPMLSALRMHFLTTSRVPDIRPQASAW